MDVLDRPQNNETPPDKRDAEGWRRHWQARGQPWRIEPEIGDDRRQFLLERLSVQPNWQEGVFPFKGVALARADVEWLLDHTGTYEAGSDASVPGLDLRGADLRRVDLSGLSFRRLRAAVTPEEWVGATDEQRDMAAIHLERANLREAHLQNAVLVGAYLARANLEGAHLECAMLMEAHLEQASLRHARLEGASLAASHLGNADLTEACLIGADLHNAQAQGANATWADLRGTTLLDSQLQGARLRGVRLQGVLLEDDDWRRLRECRPEFPRELPPADLRGATFDEATDLFSIILGDRERGFVQLADVRWGDALATVVAWSSVTMLGDEQIARQTQTIDGRPKSRETRIIEHERAIRASRQLAIVLQAQGLNEQAIRFIYRAQVLGRHLLWWRLVWGMAPSQLEDEPQTVGMRLRLGSVFAYLISLMLDMLSGYGSKPERCFFAYVITVVGFAVGHYLVGLSTPHGALSMGQALAMSIQSLHGRNFTFEPAGPQVALNTAEAVVGLLIESLIVAVITRRILGLG